MSEQEPGAGPYNIAQLAQLGGVTRRTVRYYVRRGLLQAPEGTGRGSHYGRKHLERLIYVRRLQEQGVSLAEIEQRLQPAPEPDQIQAPQSAAPVLLGEVWHKIRVADGVELHVQPSDKIDETTTHRIVDAIRHALLTRNTEEE